MEIKHRPTMLMILDGFGLNSNKEVNAIAKARTPHFDEIFKSYPHTELAASGLAVGLPEGQMGNSEVGHTNIGAGRVVFQELTRISQQAKSGEILENHELAKAMDNALENGKSLHLMGLLSDGGVHSHIEHLKALLSMAKSKGLDAVFVHCFLDGRDVPPKSAHKYISELEDFMTELGLGEIATISGRYYAMDRDNRFDRVQKAYDAIVNRKAEFFDTAKLALDTAYDRDETDEFVVPCCIKTRHAEDNLHQGNICDGDSVIMFNFRPDRAREITRAIVDPDFDGFDRGAVRKNITYICMTQYDASIPNVGIAFPPQSLSNTFGEYISALGLKQLRIAETEKYAHVTFFFNGGIEEAYPGEDRILVPSPKVATYDLQPEMSAFEVTDKVVDAIESAKYDCIILNFANADMVGHTGVMDAAIKAIEALDTCVGRISDAILKADGQILMTADHGNADEMLDENGNVMTAHSLNPVPLVHIAREPLALKDGGKLCDLAPSLLDLMGIAIPEEMSGESLIKRA